MALHTHQDAYLTTKIRWKLVPFRGIQKNTRLVRWPQRLSMRSVVPWWGSPSYQTFLRRSTSSTSPTKNSSRVWKIQWRPELSQELNHILVTFSAMVKTYSHEKSALAVVACHWSQFLRKTHKKCRMRAFGVRCLNEHYLHKYCYLQYALRFLCIFTWILIFILTWIYVIFVNVYQLGPPTGGRFL